MATSYKLNPDNLNARLAELGRDTDWLIKKLPAAQRKTFGAFLDKGSDIDAGTAVIISAELKTQWPAIAERIQSDRGVPA